MTIERPTPFRVGEDTMVELHEHAGATEGGFTIC